MVTYGRKYSKADCQTGRHIQGTKKYTYTGTLVKMQLGAKVAGRSPKSECPQTKLQEIHIHQHPHRGIVLELNIIFTNKVRQMDTSE